MEPQSIGRYEIRAEIGRGGMATVYRAYDPRFERDVAIKVLPRQLLHEPTFRARFEREAKIIAALEHTGIVPVHDFGEEDDQPYLVMRLMLGGSLAERIAQGPLPLAEAARILGQIASAIDYAHEKGIIHRDLKPGNILFDHQDVPHVSDFGIAKLTAASALTSSHTIIGTPAYMSPEQGRGEKDIDGRSDIYALGAILFEMLSGRQPYEADTPTGQIIKHITDPIPNLLAIRPDLPSDCQAIIERVMAKERDWRYASVADFASALADIAANAASAGGSQAASAARKISSGSLPAKSPKVPVSATLQAGPMPPPARPFPWLIAGVAAVILCVMVGIAALMLVIFNLPGQATPTASLTSTIQPSLAATTAIPATALPSATMRPSSTKTTVSTPTRTITPSPTPTSTALPRVIVNARSANIRTGPGTTYNVLTAVSKGSELAVIGRNADGTWLAVQMPGEEKTGWIAVSVLQLDTLIVESLPIITALPSPAPRPAQPTEKPGDDDQPPAEPPTATPVKSSPPSPTPTRVVTEAPYPPPEDTAAPTSAPAPTDTPEPPTDVPPTEPPPTEPPPTEPPPTATPAP
jgi:serine/threonine-protein kinase